MEGRRFASDWVSYRKGGAWAWSWSVRSAEAAGAVAPGCQCRVERVVLCSCDGDWPLLRTSRCVLSLPGPNCARRCGEFPLGHQYFGVLVPDAGTQIIEIAR